MQIILRDFVSLCRVCGVFCALRWLFMILRRFRQCRRNGNLLPADQAMGIGPFHVRAHGGRAKLKGEGAFSGLREIWARDIYLNGGFLSLPDKGVVLDLGANMGNFSNLALAHSPHVRVISVEPGAILNERFRESVGQNGWLDRVTLLRNFIGETTKTQTEMLSDSQYSTASFITQEELIQQNSLEKIDFLKCDVEGSEFGLLTPDSPLLVRSRQIAIEIHDDAGDRQTLLQMLRDQGFQVSMVSSTVGSCIALAKRVNS